MLEKLLFLLAFWIIFFLTPFSTMEPIGVGLIFYTITAALLSPVIIPILILIVEVCKSVLGIEEKNRPQYILPNTKKQAVFDDANGLEGWMTHPNHVLYYQSPLYQEPKPKDTYDSDAIDRKIHEEELAYRKFEANQDKNNSEN